MSNHLLVQLQRQHILLSYFKTLSVGPVWDTNPRPPAQQTGALPTELTNHNSKEDLNMNNDFASHGSSWNGIHHSSVFFTSFSLSFFNVVSYPPSTRSNCNLSVSFLTKQMSKKLSTKFTQRSDVIPYLDKNIK